MIHNHTVVTVPTGTLKIILNIIPTSATPLHEDAKMFSKSFRHLPSKHLLHLYFDISNLALWSLDWKVIKSGSQTNILPAGGIAVQHVLSKNKCAVDCGFYVLLSDVECKHTSQSTTSALGPAHNVCAVVPNITHCGTVAFHGLLMRKH